MKILILLLFTTLAVLGAAIDPTATPATPETLHPLSFAALIPFATPLLIALLKGLAPHIPKLWLPIIAPILGALLDIIIHYAGGQNVGVLTGALLGSAGVGVREVLDQVKTRVREGESDYVVPTVLKP